MASSFDWLLSSALDCSDMDSVTGGGGGGGALHLAPTVLRCAALHLLLWAILYGMVI